MTASQSGATEDTWKLQGLTFALAATFIALGNFLAVMNMTIANVALPTIAGDLGISVSQGNWVITFYAVAEAITVPLTGWLSDRFGSARIFVVAMFGFALASFVCGASGSLPTLVIGRMLQGFSGGLLMPMSQTLLLRIFPEDKSAQATALWSVTTLVAPVVGPILGGYLCDNSTWGWAFFVNTPPALVGGLVVAGIFWKRSSQTSSLGEFDCIGLMLLVVWVGCLQVMLDEGKDNDWFESTEIRLLGVVAVIGFVSFLIWELTEAHPIVNLRVFKNRGFSAAVLTLVIAFGAFFGINVLVPQWLQFNMGYTATWSGKTVAWEGVLAVVFAPMVAHLTLKVDTRLLTFIGVTWIGIMAMWLAFGNNQMTYWDVSIPFLFLGIGLPLYLVPVTGIALSNVEDRDMESAAGLMNFLRTMAGAFATSLTTTGWDDAIKFNRAELVGIANPSVADALPLDPSAPQNIGQNLLSLLIDGQSVMLSTNRMLFTLAAILFFGACTIWAAPRQQKVIDTSKVH